MDRKRLSRILGIDYGERRIGIALSDPLGIIAKPLTVIDRNISTDYISQLLDIVSSKQITNIVVGLPLTMMGGKSKQTEIVLSFIDQLKEVLSIPIITVDERLSSIAAKKSLQEQAIKTGHNKSRIDETSAAIFLQEHLDSKG